MLYELLEPNRMVSKDWRCDNCGGSADPEQAYPTYYLKGEDGVVVEWCNDCKNNSGNNVLKCSLDPEIADTLCSDPNCLHHTLRK